MASRLTGKKAKALLAAEADRLTQASAAGISSVSSKPWADRTQIREFVQTGSTGKDELSFQSFPL